MQFVGKLRRNLANPTTQFRVTVPPWLSEKKTSLNLRQNALPRDCIGDDKSSPP